ncbi:MAG TPA: alpha-glucosidase [Bacteroidales bacterium]|nr:alpha-glucosidase [Bacteroidales bacterium]
MKKILITLLAISAMLSCTHKPMSVSSPDGSLTVNIALNSDGSPVYNVIRDSVTIITDSRLGLTATSADLSRDYKIIGTKTNSADQTWETIWGEERKIRDHHNELIISLKHSSGIMMDIAVRAYDDGFAFRYLFPQQDTDSLTILAETTEYNFTQDHELWSIPWRTEYYEALWKKSPMALTDTACSPVTIEMADGTYAFMHEAALTDYPAQNFVCSQRHITTYLTPLADGTSAHIKLPFSTPWRFMTLAKTLRQLMASRIMLNLNEPCQLDDTSWIRPMKFIGIWWGMHLKTMTWHAGPQHGATTANMLRYIDFAAENGIDAVLAEGWNKGWETWTDFDFMTPYPDWDMDSISRYAANRNIAIVGHNETGGNAAAYELKLDSIYAYHQKHGIHVIKTGYVSPVINTIDGPQYNRSQAGVRHYRKVIETAARYHIAIDNHEPVMPTGLQRTLPNLMTQEGVRGQEWNAWSTDGGNPPEHVTVLPYTRVLAGPVDFTPCLFSFENPVHPETRAQSTLANQLALLVVLYSPLQMACDLPENYQQRPEAWQFVRDVPCDWERSTLIDGAIGQYTIMARQKRGADEWYLGAVTNSEARDITIPLNFLGDRQFTAVIYRDADDADWRTNPYALTVEQQTVTAADTLRLHLAAAGGCAIAIR